jgi:DNA-directed RNA polymerase specialized sigma subunit
MNNWYILLLYIFYTILHNSLSLHLTSSQIKIINNLIKYPGTTNDQRVIINRVLYLSFEKFAIKKATDFKFKHKFKCYNININDLILSSKIGLYKGIRNYNGNSNLIHYFYIYINSELLKFLTQHFSDSAIPKKERIKSKSYINNSTNYNNLLFNRVINYDDTLIHYTENLNIHNNLFLINQLEDKKNMWKIINMFDPFSKRIFYLKFDFHLNKINSNKKIADLMCCSEEHIRKMFLDKKNVLLISLTG